MATRPRIPSFRTQPSSVRRVYETLQPGSEMKETPQAFLLHIYLPGFTRDRIKITFVGSSRVVRITGERPSQGNNRWSRFDKTYPVPENCEPESLQGKFDMGTLVLTMPKKNPLISQQQIAPNSKPDQLNPSTPDPNLPKVAAVNEETTQKPQNGDKKRASSMKGPSELNNAKKASPEDTSSYASSQTQRPVERQNPEDVKRSKALSPEKSHQEQTTVKRPAVLSVSLGKPGNGQEELEAKQNSTMTSATIQKEDDDEIALKARLVEMKKQIEGKSSESRKAEMEKGIFKEKEIIRRKKVSPKEKEYRSSVSSENNMVEILGNGIRELASSASHVVARIKEGELNDEEKYLVANMGAAILVIAALGAYVSYKFGGA